MALIRLLLCRRGGAGAGAALRLRDVLQRVFDVFAAALPGGLQADDAGDLVAHG